MKSSQRGEIVPQIVPKHGSRLVEIDLKIMVPLGAVESLWVPLGAERFGCRSFRFKVQGSRCARGVNLVVTS